MANRVLLAVLTAHIACFWHSSKVSAFDEKRLIAGLIQGYTPLGRPVQNASETVNVALSMSLSRVTEAYPEQKKLVLFAGLRYMWTDVALQWDPAEFGGITRINLATKYIWSPDFEHINALEPPMSMFIRTPAAKVNNRGIVTLESMYKFTTDCSGYERGVLTCNIIMGSYSTTSDLVNITTPEKHVSTDSYITNEDWEVHSSKVYIQQFWFNEASSTERYVRASFEIKLRERDWHAKTQEKTDNSAPGGNNMAHLLLVMAMLLVVGYV